MAEAWSFSIAFAMQMYFDFSGYSDMAIGSALLLGIEIPRNFDAPLRATSITDFWRRWHISLSQFITTYLYTPLVKAMRRRDLFSSPLLASTVSVFVAMTIAGLWHGPAMTFVLWGVIHGAALACNQYWNKKSTWQIPAFPAWLMTFMVFDVALVYFRAESVHAGSAMLMSMLNPHHALGLTTLQPALRGLTRLQLLIIPAGLAAAFFGKSSDHLSREFKPHLANALLIGAAYVACWCFMVFNTAQTFLYFKF
jgi:D-alanyl-lipoteichoic acid acyltransferase DltB (MBOAT superfamily)